MPKLFRYFSEPIQAENFVRRGEMLFRALSYYRDYEDKGVRSDEYEGTLVHAPKNGLKLRRVSNGEEIPVFGQFESSAKEDDIFVCCFSTEMSRSTASQFQAEVCVEIADASKLISRVRAALARRPHIKDKLPVHEEVRYYDPNEPPIVDWALPERIALRKPRTFSWQHEYRIAFSRNNAFRVENVEVKVVNPAVRRKPRRTEHPSMLLKVGKFAKECRIYQL